MRILKFFLALSIILSISTVLSACSVNTEPDVIGATIPEEVLEKKEGSVVLLENVGLNEYIINPNKKEAYAYENVDRVSEGVARSSSVAFDCTACEGYTIATIGFHESGSFFAIAVQNEEFFIIINDNIFGPVDKPTVLNSGTAFDISMLAQQFASNVFSDNGQSYLYPVTVEGEVAFIRDGQLELRPDIEFNFQNIATLSPDGSTFSYVSFADNKAIMYIDGERTGSYDYIHSIRYAPQGNTLSYVSIDFEGAFMHRGEDRWGPYPNVVQQILALPNELPKMNKEGDVMYVVQEVQSNANKFVLYENDKEISSLYSQYFVQGFDYFGYGPTGKRFYAWVQGADAQTPRRAFRYGEMSENIAGSPHFQFALHPSKEMFAYTNDTHITTRSGSVTTRQRYELGEHTGPISSFRISEEDKLSYYIIRDQTLYLVTEQGEFQLYSPYRDYLVSDDHRIVAYWASDVPFVQAAESEQLGTSYVLVNGEKGPEIRDVMPLLGEAFAYGLYTGYDLEFSDDANSVVYTGYKDGSLWYIEQEILN